MFSLLLFHLYLLSLFQFLLFFTFYCLSPFIRHSSYLTIFALNFFFSTIVFIFNFTQTVFSFFIAF
jgi:hypothetical protein